MNPPEASYDAVELWSNWCSILHNVGIKKAHTQSRYSVSNWHCQVGYRRPTEIKRQVNSVDKFSHNLHRWKSFCWSGLCNRTSSKYQPGSGGPPTEHMFCFIMISGEPETIYAWKVRKWFSQPHTFFVNEFFFQNRINKTLYCVFSKTIKEVLVSSEVLKWFSI